MGSENLRLPGTIGCIDTQGLRATLISTVGNHCDVWRVTRRRVRDGEVSEIDFVIKRPTLELSYPEIRLLLRDWRMLRTQLGDMVPQAVFIATEVDGVPNMVVVAEAVQRWFNIANPLFADDVMPLLARDPKARVQLAQFISVAYSWYDEGRGRLIDLYGLDNLVLDVNRNIRYIDSFNVFFYPDMLDYEDDAQLREKIDVSLKRLHYLSDVLHESTPSSH